MSDEKTCRNCVMYQDGYCNRDGMHADKTKPGYSCRWWFGWNKLPATLGEFTADIVCQTLWIVGLIVMVIVEWMR